MQYGFVNDDIEATVVLNVLDEDDDIIPVTFLIDTGATGEMTLPQGMIDRLNLSLAEDADNIGVTLADGSSSAGRLYPACIFWHSILREVEVVNIGTEPLIGMRLLYGSNLNVDAVPGGLATITELPPASQPETLC